MKRAIINSIYLPITLSSNKYVDIVQNAMKKAGITISGLKECRSPKKLKSIDVINLNWFESRIDKESLKDTIIYYVGYSLLLCVFKIFRIKIIATMHNTITHDAKHSKISNRFFRKVLYRADAIICMNKLTFKILNEIGGEELKRKGYYIPHPSYYGSYEEYDCDKLNLPKDQFNLLFMGLVRPYKNIEMILKAANELKELSIHFYICGYAEDEAYGKKIVEATKGKNTSVHLRFFDDIEMVEWIKRSDAILLPYSNVSSLNSGAAVLAFSYGTTAIGTLNGTLQEFDNNLIYGYGYQNDAEHYDKLKSSIVKAYKDFTTDKEGFRMKGFALQKKVNNEWNPKVIGELYYDLYSELISRKKK